MRFHVQITCTLDGRTEVRSFLVEADDIAEALRVAERKISADCGQIVNVQIEKIARPLRSSRHAWQKGLRRRKVAERVGFEPTSR